MATMLNVSAQEQTVKRLLRRIDSEEYFNGGGWTPDPAEAEFFADALEAAETCARFKLTHVELALRVEASASDVFCTPMC